MKYTEVYVRRCKVLPNVRNIHVNNDFHPIQNKYNSYIIMNLLVYNICLLH